MTSAAETPKETTAETPTETGPEDLSDVEKVIAWSNWPLYIDYDDEEVGRPTLDAFSQQTGIEVTYKTRGNRCIVTCGDIEFQCMRWDLCQRVNELGLDKMLGQ